MGHAPSWLRRRGREDRSPIAGLDVWRSFRNGKTKRRPRNRLRCLSTPAEARARLEQFVGDAGEARSEQVAYAEAAAYAFSPRERAGAPKIALIEAGTGIGKTLGYLAPASLWAEKNGAGLWLSTYTRNLQRQIVQEIARLYPDPAEREEKAVVRKGRENYLCLLNFEEAAKRTALAPGQRAVALGLIARWVAGDARRRYVRRGLSVVPRSLGSFGRVDRPPRRMRLCGVSALSQLLHRARHPALAPCADRRRQPCARHRAIGARLDSASTKRTTRRPSGACVMCSTKDIIFSMRPIRIRGVRLRREMAELRRWISGPEGRARSRARGLEERLKDLVADDEAAQSALDEAVAAAGALAGDGWMTRLHRRRPRGPGEAFLAAAYAACVGAQRRRAKPSIRVKRDTEAAGRRILSKRRAQLAHALCAALPRRSLRLAQSLRKLLDDEAEELETYSRARIEAAARGLERRAKLIVPAWIAMLDALETRRARDEFVDWFEIEREDGRDADVGLAAALDRSHDSAGQRSAVAGAWRAHHVGDLARCRNGAKTTGSRQKCAPARTICRSRRGAPASARRSVMREQARIFIVKDVERRDVEALAAAYARIVSRVRRWRDRACSRRCAACAPCEERIEAPLADAGLTLYAQHVDRLDTGALVDLFRAEENACLLGTDALRDGVDVPGRSLRLVVFDKVPWPKPTILHKARRARFGKSYDDLLTRLRLKQAFGRLIRSQDDKGCFVILESATPSRLADRFPAGSAGQALRPCGGHLGHQSIPAPDTLRVVSKL